MEAYHLTPIVKHSWWLLILTSNGPTSLIRFTCLQWLQCVPAQVRSQWPFPGSRPKIERPRKTGCTAWNFNHILHTHQIVLLTFCEKPKCQGKQNFWQFYPIPSVLLYRCLLYSQSQFAHNSEKIRQSVCQTSVRSCSSRSLQQIQEVYSPPWLIESILFNQWPGNWKVNFWKTGHCYFMSLSSLHLAILW